MNHYRRFICKATIGIFFLLLFSPQINLFAQDGQAIFKSYCASCHKPDKDFTGPALKGARQREPSPEWAYKWVGHVDEMIVSDPYAKKLC